LRSARGGGSCSWRSSQERSIVTPVEVTRRTHARFLEPARTLLHRPAEAIAADVNPQQTAPEQAPRRIQETLSLPLFFQDEIACTEQVKEFFTRKPLSPAHELVFQGSSRSFDGVRRRFGKNKIVGRPSTTPALDILFQPERSVKQKLVTFPVIARANVPHLR
jgi:hypothetical protein